VIEVLQRDGIGGGVGGRGHKLASGHAEGAAGGEEAGVGGGGEVQQFAGIACAVGVSGLRIARSAVLVVPVGIPLGNDAQFAVGFAIAGRLGTDGGIGAESGE